MTNTPDLGEQIRKAREAAGMTQTQAAEAAGITQPYLHQLEAGKRTAVSAVLLKKLAAALGTQFVIGSDK